MKKLFVEKLDKEAHLWIVSTGSVKNETTLADCMAVLSEQEKRRYKRFRFADDRHRFLVSHALVRTVLSKYAGIPADQWVFSQSDRGRPEVANPGLSQIRFNLSHSSGLAVCLVAAVCDCGVDVERVQSRHNPIGVARRMFSTGEYEHMKGLRGREQLEYFFTRWTLREAYTKARGVGISLPTHRLNFHVRSSTDIAIEFREGIEDRQQDWQFELFRLDHDHIAAAAIRRSDQINKTIIRYQMMNDLESYRLVSTNLSGHSAGGIG